MSNRHSGYLFRSSAAAFVAADAVAGARISRLGRLKVASGDWFEYDLETNEPIDGSGDEGEKKDGPFHYRVIVRQREEFAIVAAEARRVIDFLLTGLWKANGFRKWEINVHSLVMNIIAKEFKMSDGSGAVLVPCISYLHANTIGYSPQMETASFKGKDLSVSRIVIEHKTKMIFDRCGVRIPSEQYEKALMAFDGGLDFPNHALHAGASRDGSSILEELILTLRDGHYLRSDDDVPSRFT